LQTIQDSECHMLIQRPET